MGGEMLRVMEEKWDYLIILDACRYDYFSDIYESHFLGDLDKRISLGSTTAEWCNRSFPRRYSDVIYISGNPIINSRLKIRGFDAKKHFFKIIDVWDSGWDEELSTVPPKQINRFSLNFSERFPEKRQIIHYMQPHEPYLSDRFSAKKMLKNRRYDDGLSRLQTYLRRIPLADLGNLLLVRTGILNHLWELREAFNLPPASIMDAIRREYGTDGLREAYRENLTLVLEHARMLCGDLLANTPSERIVITSDHGELLGENGDFSHRGGCNNPFLLDVPFLRVENVRRTSNTA